MKLLYKRAADDVGRYSIRYASGNFAKSLLESTFGLLYLFFLVDVVHLDPEVAAGVLLASMLLDAAFNPIVGYAIDRWLRMFGSYQRLILFAAPFGAGFFAVLFVLPAVTATISGVEVFIATVLFRAGCTLVDLPHNAMLAGLTPDGRGRVRLSTWRFFFSTAGNVVVVFGVAPTLSATGSPIAVDFIAPVAAIGCLYLCVILFSATGTSARETKPVAPPETRTYAAIIEIARNVRLVQILLVCVLSAGLITVFMRATVFYAKAALGDASFVPYLVGVQMCGQLLGLPAWHWMATRTEKTTTATAAQLLLAVSLFVFYIISPTSLAAALPLFFAVGFAVGGLTVMNWAIVPDTVEYTEAACGRRHEALTFGTLLFLNKAASGLALAIVGWVLAAIDYDVMQASASADSLIAVMAVIPAIGAIGSAIILGNLRLTYQGHRALLDSSS